MKRIRLAGIMLLLLLCAGCAQAEISVSIDPSNTVEITADILSSVSGQSNLYQRLEERMAAMGMATSVSQENGALHGAAKRSFASAPEAAAYINQWIQAGFLPLDEGAFSAAQTSYGTAYRFQGTTDYSEAAEMGGNLDLPAGLMEEYGKSGVEVSLSIRLPATEVYQSSGQTSLSGGMAEMNCLLSPEGENRLYLDTGYWPESGESLFRKTERKRNIFLLVTLAGAGGALGMTAALVSEEKRARRRRRKRSGRAAGREAPS